MPRIGVLSNLTEDDPEARARDAAFVQGLRQLDWIAGRNVQIEYRYAAADPARFRSFAAELAGLGPNVVLAYTSPAVAALQQAMPSVPIVFASVIDPVGAGIVETLARPGGNATGFTVFEYGIAGEMVGAAERDCPGGDAGCHHSRSRHPCRHRPVCRYPVRRALAGNRVQRHRRARSG
jgi:putative ABC transport system substrate-binding protein